LIFLVWEKGNWVDFDFKEFGRGGMIYKYRKEFGGSNKHILRRSCCFESSRSFPPVSYRCCC
jgi:hypothetical protein